MVAQDAGSLLTRRRVFPATHRTGPPYAVLPLLSVSQDYSLTPGWLPVAGKAKKWPHPLEVRVQPEILLQRISRSLSVISCRVYILQMSTKNLAEAGPCFGLRAGRIIGWSRVNTSRRPEVLVMVPQASRVFGAILVAAQDQTAFSTQHPATRRALMSVS